MLCYIILLTVASRKRLNYIIKQEKESECIYLIYWLCHKKHFSVRFSGLYTTSQR